LLRGIAFDQEVVLSIFSVVVSCELSATRICERVLLKGASIISPSMLMDTGPCRLNALLPDHHSRRTSRLTNIRHPRSGIRERYLGCGKDRI